MRKLLLITCLLGSLALLSCRRGGGAGEVRSVYYWSTVLDIDSQKAAFIGRHGVSRVYLRYFDVVPDEAGRPVPNATLRFKTGVPRGVEVVPTVYVVNSCMAADTSGLAERIVRRVAQMCETNGIGPVSELQIDCDWTRRTRERYFAFLRTVGRLAADRGMRVSATIRLHQLAEAPPPVDRGVLMMYNTGDFTSPDCEKPILDMRDAAPYVGNLGRYGLPSA